ncbi:MAG: hypothetical protein K0Q79_3298 [Flavipsychrobacter sp.]|nr:hypothetical protein [Flavipsychrobacter sp.]
MHCPCYPAESLCWAIVYSINGEYLCHHPGIGANAAWGDDHAHAAIYQHYEGGEDAEVSGVGQGQEAEVDLAKVGEPDKHCVENELPALLHMEDREHTMGELLHKAAKPGFFVTPVHDDRSDDKDSEDGDGDEEDVLVVAYLLFEVLHHVGNEVGDGSELEQEGEDGHDKQTEDIESALCHNGAYHFMGGHFLVLGKDGALGHLATAGYGQVGDVAYEHGHSGIGKGGVHAGGLQQIAPAHRPEKVGQEADYENREGVPEVNLVQGGDELLFLLGGELVQHVVDDPYTQPEENYIL